MKCTACEDLEELETFCPDECHHGGDKICDVCDAEYHEEYNGKLWAGNDKALENHPELKRI